MQIAPTTTLLGLLQRGRGRGYLDARARRDGGTRRALTVCIIADPRSDRQVEDRGEYYGRLAYELDVELAPIEAHLFDPADQSDPDEFRTGLALETLSWMGRLGHTDAVRLLRRYVQGGWNWEWALSFMADLPRPLLDGLDELVVDRSGSIEHLSESIARYRGAVLQTSEARLWRDWAELNPRIAEAADIADRRWAENDSRRRELRSRPTDELLRGGHEGALRDRTSAADRELLRSAARAADPALRKTALKVLGFQRDPGALDLAEAELRRDPAADFNPGWFVVQRLIDTGPIEHVRQWVDDENERLNHLALRAIARWPRPEDATRLRAVLELLNEEDWLYTVCEAVDGLARLHDAAAAPSLERVFKEATYSYLRRRAARALAAVDPRFAGDLALECLWDCEEDTREIGVAEASWSSAEVRGRVRQLAWDRLQPRRVRALAARRLRAMSS